MLSAQSIQAAIRNEVENRIKVYPCNNLRASNIGHPCERYLYLLIRHWDEQEPHDYGLQNLSLIHISEPTRRNQSSRMPSSA